jgi:hypothetical protein
LPHFVRQDAVRPFRGLPSVVLAPLARPSHDASRGPCSARPPRRRAPHLRLSCHPNRILPIGVVFVPVTPARTPRLHRSQSSWS